MKSPFVRALLRLLRALIAAGLPVLISYLAGHTDLRLLGLGPVIQAIAKYLRTAFGLTWLPI